MDTKKAITISLIIVGITLLIAGCVWGGIYYYTHMRSPEIFEFTLDPSENPKVEKRAAGEKLSESDKMEETKKREEYLKAFLEYPYFRLPMIAVPVVRDGRVHAYLHLRIAMRAISHESFKKSKILLPRLVDGIYSDLYKAFENLWNQRYDPTTSVIKERVFAVTEKILGKNHIDTIYLREIVFKRVD